MASSLEEALMIANRIGYPLMVRPSYVLGGRAMEIIYDEEMLKQYVKAAVEVTPERPILIDRFLVDAIECEADAICDGENVFVPSVMEHIELAGVHSGDSACAIPPDNIKKEHIETIEKYTKMLALELNVIGLLNIQYAIVNDTVYILEANPRASRTVPLVSKVCGIPMAKIATKLMLGSKLSPDLAVKKKIKHFGVKEAVFPFNMFPEVDPVLGPEMRSTGEVLGIANSFGVAYFKAQDAAGWRLPLEGNILITVNRKDREGALEVAKKFHSLGFTIIATEGTSKYLDEHGIPAQMVFKLNEGRPDVVDRIKNKEINLIINTPFGRISEVDDSYIRKAAIKYKIPYITTIAAARAAVRGIEMIKQYGEETPKSLQEYHSEMS